MIIKENKAARWELIKYLSFIFVAILIVGSVIVPLPYYIEVPGSAENVREFVTVDGKRDKEEGSYMLTTVGIRRGTAASLLTSHFMPFQEVISKKSLMGESSGKEYDILTSFQMDSSENMAKKVALDLADLPYEMDYQGVYVIGLTDNSDFKNKLELGDIIKKIDGKDFSSTEKFMKYIKEQKIGKEIEITYQRDGETLKTAGKLSESPIDKKTAIGITLIDQTELKSSTEIEIDAGDIGGPSAGLMFTLETYQLLMKKDLRKGREIAGTGTINSDGSVGSIGGIDKKVVAADNAGATIFFAPAEEYSAEIKKEYPDLKTNYEEAVEAAKKIKTKMKIIPVKSVQDVIEFLEK